MESSLGLLSLPEEVLQHLGKYLSLNDVVSCSKTCHYLRSVLNHNLVWKRYLPQDILRLETQNQYVQPTFQHNFQSSISPLCSFRLLIMKKMHLLNNWRNGNFAYKSSKTKFSYSSSVFNIPKGHGKIIYEHRYIFTSRFINDVHSDAIELWDVENEPVLHCSLPIKDIEYDSFYVIGDYLVVIICRKVDVYEINLTEKAFPLKYSFIITEDFVSFNTNAPHIGRHDFNCVGWSHSSVDQYLLSNKCGEDPCVLHVWDILNATKTGTFLSPVQGFSICLHCKMGSDWILSQNFQSGDGINYLSFDIKKQEFSDNYFNLDSQFLKNIIFHLNYVLVFRASDDNDQDTICSLYDFNSSIKLKERQFDNPRRSYELESTIIVNGSFVMLCAGCFQVVDAISLEVLESIECSPMLTGIISQYNIFGNLFVVAFSRKMSIKWDSSFELWDIKKMAKVTSFPKPFIAPPRYLDDLGMKVVLFDFNEIIVIHCW